MDLFPHLILFFSAPFRVGLSIHVSNSWAQLFGGLGLSPLLDWRYIEKKNRIVCECPDVSSRVCLAWKGLKISNPSYPAVSHLPKCENKAKLKLNRITELICSKASGGYSLYHCQGASPALFPLRLSPAAQYHCGQPSTVLKLPAHPAGTHTLPSCL